MKKIFVMVIMAAALFVSSCSAQKTVSNSAASIAGEIEVADNVCDVYAAEAPAIRATGVGTHYKEQSATNIAEAQARGRFASSIASAIIAATKEIGVSMDQYIGDDTEGRSITDASSESGDYVTSIAKEIVKNTSQVKKTRAMKKNKQWVIHVCMEYMGTESKMAEDIEKKLEEKIAPEQRKKLHERHKEFEEYIINSLKP